MQPRRLAQFLLTAAAFDAAVAIAQPTPLPTSDVAELGKSLYEYNARLEQRDQAAQRLLARPDPAARDLIRNAVRDFGQPNVQLAVARALAAKPTPDTTLVAPLLELLDPYSSDAVLENAGRALSAFKSDETVLKRLLELADKGDERIRVVAIRTLGTMPDKRAAAALAPLADASAQSPRIAAAGAAALAYLTGLPVSTDWRAWWDANRAKTDAQFLADLSRNRALRYDLAQARVSELEDEFFRTLSDIYKKTPGDQKTDLLVRYLRSPDASVRFAACRIAQEVAANDVVPQQVKEQLRQLVGDATADVRRGAAKALALVNDRDALVPLLTQLNQETDSTVRAAIADALRPIRDDRAVPALLALLDDPSADTAQVAAEALTEAAAPLRQSDPPAADAAADRIVKTMQARTTPQNNVDLRNALVQALGPLRSRGAINPLLKMLGSPAEDRRVRRSLLASVGDYQNPNYTDNIVAWMNDKGDAETRKAAVRALGESADSFGDLQQPLAERIDPVKEPQSDIRDAAWYVLTKLFPKATDDQLTFWENKLKNDPLRLLVVLREQRDRAVRSGNAMLAADKNQQIGDTSMAVRPPLFDDAIAAYTSALNYARTNNKPVNVEYASVGLQKAYLKNRQFAQAVNLTQDSIREDPKFQNLLGANIAAEAERLFGEQKEYELATQLVDLALKMKPGLAPSYIERLENTRLQVKNRFNQRNESPLQPDDMIQTALAR